ncbi:DUF4349 domain-containing protein [Coleofasciculus sp. FACHB-712]|uniref:DUF4349 domain-containing protein n=1 Tax=Coleofasciculus sp. FACHB-712 TaxID=2692789 RepID=UPI001688DEE7|nr:DUF4349 domain-containing protein [Coleofasciculus sp. FACHB-712]MBD1942662.1 DUF4349 domain-containing protein [Coleofasciculus sp. FACHB-712]
MNGSLHPKLKPSLFLSALLGGIVLTSCASSFEQKTQLAQLAPTAPNSEPMANSAAEAGAVRSQNIASPAGAKAQVPRQRPQLIKNAELSVSVNSIEKSIEIASKIVKQQQGDLLGFQDQKPKDENARHTASMQIRVPQEQLETSLDFLAKLGTVQRRTLTAEDVTDQLVDNEARLRNLRKQESTLLKIMERSGSVGDVLKVANELSNVRQNIEQLDAQLKSLRSRVAYSTITLTLEEAIAGIPPARPLGSDVRETWNQATHSLGELTTSLIRLAIWLAVFSPFLLVLVAVPVGYQRFKQQRSQSAPQPSEPPHAG